MSRATAEMLLGHTLNIRLMTRAGAERYLDQYLPTLEGQDREYALSLAGVNLPKPTPHTPRDAIYCTAMYMAGVSQGDLANLFGVRRQTIQQKINRTITKAERATLRDELQVMDLEVLALTRRMFMDSIEIAPTVYDNVFPIDIGRALIQAATKVIMQDRGEGDTPKPSDRPRRYANMNISTPMKEEIAELASLHNIPEEELTPKREVHDVEIPPQPASAPSAQPNVLRPEELEFLKGL